MNRGLAPNLVSKRLVRSVPSLHVTFGRGAVFTLPVTETVTAGFLNIPASDVNPVLTKNVSTSKIAAAATYVVALLATSRVPEY